MDLNYNGCIRRCWVRRRRRVPEDTAQGGAGGLCSVMVTVRF